MTVGEEEMEVVVPEGVSEERQKLLKAYGAEVILTSAYDGMRGTLEKAKALRDQNERIDALRGYL